ncbi:MAG: sensor histidine kinase, partial [Leifsonia xyli]
MTTASVLPPPPPAEPSGDTPSTPSTGSTAALTPRVRIASPGRVAGAAAQLVALGLIGPTIFGALFGLLGAGVGMLFALLFGVVLLAGLVYALFGIAWFERARVDGLYGIGLPALR